MDSETGQLIVQALRDSGSFSEEALTSAATLCETEDDPTAIAQNLLNSQLFTMYQARKFVKGRLTDLFFGKYFIQEKIGEGGMGRVYRAINRETQQAVALKVVRQALLKNSSVMKRYEREVDAVAALDHQNIVKLLEADEYQGRYYLSMEYVHGVDLSRLTRKVGNTPHSGLEHAEEACEYIRQAALGLHHAHEAGFVHRDIKPSNMIVSGERATPTSAHNAQVKILDLGLVRSILNEEENLGNDLTRDGTVVGTPDYMSPEQGRNSSTVDRRADVYSLGCALFFLLKGHPPFPDGHPIDKLIRHQLDPIPNLRALRPDLHRDLVTIIEVMTNKKPDERFNTALEVAELLAAFSSNPSIRADAVDPGTFQQKSYEHIELAASPDSIAQPKPSSQTDTVEAKTHVLDGADQTQQSGGMRLRIVQSNDSTPLAEILDSMTPPNAMNAAPNSNSSQSGTRVPRSTQAIARANPVEPRRLKSDLPTANARRQRHRKSKTKEPFMTLPIWLIVGGVIFLLLLFTAIVLK